MRVHKVKFGTLTQSGDLKTYHPIRNKGRTIGKGIAGMYGATPAKNPRWTRREWAYKPAHAYAGIVRVIPGICI